MIISRTPLRISLMGGGTDFPRYYLNHGGAVLNAAIDKYMYVMVNRRFARDVRVAYTKTEIVEHFGQLQHELIREAMRLTGATEQLDIATVSDIPARGTGLGSSSAVTVGALNALHAYLGRHVSGNELSRQACEIEIDTLNHPIGKQDQYIAAHGGVRFIHFQTNGDVVAEPLPCTKARRQELEDNVMLFYTGVTRNSNDVLAKQNSRTELNVPLLDRLTEMASRMREVVGGAGDLDEVGELLHENWELKKQLAQGITNDGIDAWYSAARSAGAIGGKITGAGGGGFFVLYCPRDRHGSVRAALSDMEETRFRFEPHGSQIIFVSD
jgi:D-glycero-alpha-D-manno-heptose-7-phosphate kinase